MKKKILITFVVIFILLLAALCLLYFQRNYILDNIVRSEIEKEEHSRDVIIRYTKLNMEGIRRVQFSDLYIVPKKGETFAHIGKLDFAFNFWQIVKGNVEISDLKLDGMEMNLIEKDGQRNFDFLLHSKNKKSSKESLDKNGYVGKLSRVFSVLFRFFPDAISVNEMKVNLERDSFRSTIYLPELNISDHKFCSQILVSENGENQHLVLDGSFSNAERMGSGCVYALNGDKLKLPYFKYKYDTDVEFDTLRIDFQLKEDNKDKLVIEGKAFFDKLSLKNVRLSDTTVVLDKGGIDYVVNVFPKEVELDSTSVVRINQLCFSPYINLRKEPDWKVRLMINKENFPAQDLFASLPEGLFENLKGIETEGNLSYHLFFNLDMAQVDSLKFHSSMKKDGFKIVKYGKTNFAKMNEPFIYNAYEDGKLVKSFMVGEEYENFCHLDQISPYLQAAVMYSEDGSFYTHAGFLESALTSSIIKNIKEGRFARGGSTISMQLIKNLYLNRDKTLTRKLEEALIVWLVENNRIAPKERMYEIYLNIIEWGPGIYGAKEASNFYFGKDPSKLTPEESIYMSSIIPRPKKFMWFFDADNNLKPFLEGHYRLVGKRMFDHQFVTEKQFNEMKPNVKITGRAKDYLAKKSGEQPVNIEEDIDDDDSWGFFKKTNSFFKGLMKKDKEKEDSSNEKK